MDGIIRQTGTNHSPDCAGSDNFSVRCDYNHLLHESVSGAVQGTAEARCGPVATLNDVVASGNIAVLQRGKRGNEEAVLGFNNDDERNQNTEQTRVLRSMLPSKLCRVHIPLHLTKNSSRGSVPLYIQELVNSALQDFCVTQTDVNPVFDFICTHLARCKGSANIPKERRLFTWEPHESIDVLFMTVLSDESNPVVPPQTDPVPGKRMRTNRDGDKRLQTFQPLPNVGVALEYESDDNNNSEGSNTGSEGLALHTRLDKHPQFGFGFAAGPSAPSLYAHATQTQTPLPRSFKTIVYIPLIGFYFDGTPCTLFGRGCPPNTCLRFMYVMDYRGKPNEQKTLQALDVIMYQGRMYQNVQPRDRHKRLACMLMDGMFPQCAVNHVWAGSVESMSNFRPESTFRRNLQHTIKSVIEFTYDPLAPIYRTPPGEYALPSTSLVVGPTSVP